MIVLCNLKPRNMRGIKSHGMLMCASNAAHDIVEPLSPPEGAATGERVYFGEDGADQPEAESPNKVSRAYGCYRHPTLDMSLFMYHGRAAQQRLTEPHGTPYRGLGICMYLESGVKL